MKVGISSGAEADVADGYWFYERQVSVWVTTFDRAFLRTSNLWSTLVEFTRSLMVFIDRCRSVFHSAFITRLRENS